MNGMWRTLFTKVLYFLKAKTVMLHLIALSLPDLNLLENLLDYIL